MLSVLEQVRSQASPAEVAAVAAFARALRRLLCFFDPVQLFSAVEH